MWIHRCLSSFTERHTRFDLVLAVATLVDFPGFQDAHGIMFELLSGHDERHQFTYNTQEWELYVRYRHILSEFLMDQRRSGALFVGKADYLKLAEYFWSFLVTGNARPLDIPIWR
jgi:hypothetical protein